MSKTAHILAVEIERPLFSGFTRMNPVELLAKGQVWLGHRPYLEELDPENLPVRRKPILQIIPYVILRKGEKILGYVRPSAGNETRLHGQLSVGFGGHVDLADIVHHDSNIDLEQTLRQACARELLEEINLEVDPAKIQWSGVIYRSDGPVDRVHLGIVAEIDLDEQSDDIFASEETGEILLLEPSKLETIMAEYQVETWSQAYLSTL